VRQEDQPQSLLASHILFMVRWHWRTWPRWPYKYAIYRHSVRQK